MNIRWASMASGLFLWVILSLIGSSSPSLAHSCPAEMSIRWEYPWRQLCSCGPSSTSLAPSCPAEMSTYKVSIHHGVRCVPVGHLHPHCEYNVSTQGVRFVPVGHLHLHCEYDVSTRYSWRQVCSNRPSSIHAWRREVGTIKYKTGKSTIAAVSSLQKCFCHQRKLFLC